jgi:hypothetical protein
MITTKINLWNSINYHPKQVFTINTYKVLLELMLAIDFRVSLSIILYRVAFSTVSNPLFLMHIFKVFLFSLRLK